MRTSDYMISWTPLVSSLFTKNLSSLQASIPLRLSFLSLLFLCMLCSKVDFFPRYLFREVELHL